MIASFHRISAPKKKKEEEEKEGKLKRKSKSERDTSLHGNCFPTLFVVAAAEDHRSQSIKMAPLRWQQR